MIKILLVFILMFDFTGQSFQSNLENVPVLKDDTKEIDVVVTAQAGAAYDIASNSFLWKKNFNQLRPIASLTKLITGILLTEEKLPADKIITMTEQDQRAEGGNRHLYKGEKLRIEDAFYTAFMASDNEAIMALVRASGYTEEEFVKKMNSWLKDNNFLNTKVFDPTGLNPNNVSTAHDMAKIAQFAFSKADLTKFLRPSTHRFIIKNTGRIVNLKNTNQLLSSDFGVKFGKTGYTEEAGYCFVSQAVINGREVISVVLGSDSKNDRFQDTKALLYWLKTNFNW